MGPEPGSGTESRCTYGGRTVGVRLEVGGKDVFDGGRPDDW